MMNWITQVNDQQFYVTFLLGVGASRGARVSFFIRNLDLTMRDSGPEEMLLGQENLWAVIMQVFHDLLLLMCTFYFGEHL